MFFISIFGYNEGETERHILPSHPNITIISKTKNKEILQLYNLL